MVQWPVERENLSREEEVVILGAHADRMQRERSKTFWRICFLFPGSKQATFLLVLVLRLQELHDDCGGDDRDVIVK